VRQFFMGVAVGDAIATLVYWSATEQIVAAIKGACF
jgi:hypothetical protein